MMRVRVFGAALLAALFATSPAFAQSTYSREAEIRRQVPYSTLLREVPGLTYDEYLELVKQYAQKEQRQERLIAPRATPQYRYQRPVPQPSVPRYTPPSVEAPAAPLLPSYEATRPRTTHDWQSGNTYTTRKKFNGDTQVDGYNFGTGSSWQTTIKPNGSMRGTDKNLNSWTYDARSGMYINYGTGQICTGEGYGRVCSK